MIRSNPRDAGQKSFENEAASRLECQRDYLIRHQSISPEQVTTIDGGYREKSEVELYMVSRYSPKLLPFPTVRPSQVTIIPKPVSTNVLSLCQLKTHL